MLPTPACPKCKSTMGITCDADARLPRPPQAGDFAVCYLCGQIVQFEGENAGTVRAVADCELLEMPVVTRQQLRRMRQIVRDRVERMN